MHSESGEHENIYWSVGLIIYLGTQLEKVILVTNL